MLLTLIILLIAANQVTLFTPQQTITRCPKQCACNAEHLADLPLMKWLTIPMNKYWQQNDSLFDNEVWDNNDEIQLERNPLLHAAFCVFQEDAKSIDRDEFAPLIEALTILYGPDSTSRTIEYELSSFHDLIALDLQGYQQPLTTYSEILLNPNALLELQNLQYLNIQDIRLVPNPNSTNKDIPQAAYEYLQTILLKQGSGKSQTVTFVVPDEPEIVPYEEFKKQQSNNIISTFSHLADLLFLRLYQCKLESIRWEMFDGLVNLQTLSLEGNEITKIPEFAFYGMPNLKVLILSRNKLTTISTESLAGLFYLEHLDLTNNHLRHLSDITFAPIPALLSLDIRHNPLVFVQKNTFELMNITRVLFIGNDNNAVHIQSLAFNGLIELEKLELAGLNVSVLDNSLLHGMPLLKYLKLEGRVEYIHFDAFASSVQLEILLLKNCSLRYLSMDAFYGLNNLKILDLSDNNLANLPIGIFDGLDSLVELILTYNKLTSLPSNAFDSLYSIQMIALNNNPWDCTCRLSSLPSRTVSKVKQVKFVEKCNYQYDKTPCKMQLEESYVYSAEMIPKCATPEEYSGWNLLHVINKKLKCRRQAKHLKNENSDEVWPDQTNILPDSDKNTMHGEGDEWKLVKNKYFRKQIMPANEMDRDNPLIDLSDTENMDKKLNEVQDL